MISPDFYLKHDSISMESSLPTLRYALPIESKIVLEVYDDAGDRIVTLVDEKKTAGEYHFDLNNINHKLGKGTYFCRMAAYDDSAKTQYVNVRKLTVESIR